MNYLLIALLIIVLLYLQYNFLSFFNLLLIALLVGVYIAFQNNSILSMAYFGIIGIILVISMVFKIINVAKYSDKFEAELSQLQEPSVTSNLFLSKDQSQLDENALNGMDELDLSDELEKEKCAMRENFQPQEFVEGDQARNILNACANVCAQNENCNVVVMKNINGKNDECKFYDAGEASDFKKELEKLNQTTDPVKAMHAAVLTK